MRAIDYAIEHPVRALLALIGVGAVIGVLW